MLTKSSNRIIYDSEKDVSQRSSSSTVPSLLNDTPFYEDIVLQPTDSVNTEDKQFRQKLPSDRAILANALESTIDEASDPKSADIIKRYKAQINTITDAEKRLGEVNEEIKSLAFAKGKRDTNRLRVLYDEKAEPVKKIDRFDKSLLRLESTSVLKNLLTREKAKVRAATNAKAREKLNAYKKRAAEREANIRAEGKEKLSETRQKERDKGTVL